jgi:2-dehydropantoate 2-reductase
MLARGAAPRTWSAHGIRIRGWATSAPGAHAARPARSWGRQRAHRRDQTPGTAEALTTLRHARFGVTLSIQNGTLKDELLRQAFGAERVLGALADTSGELLPEGDVLFTRNVNILVGELAGGESARAQQLAHTLDAAGVRAASSPEILVLEWSKFCSWVGLIALAVTTRAATWKYLSDPDSALVLVRLVREMGRLAQALGIGLAVANPPPTRPVRGERACGGGRGHRGRCTTGSMRRSTACRRCRTSRAGRPWSEWDLRLRVAKARALDLKLPLLETFTLLLGAIDRARAGSVGDRRGGACARRWYS